MNNNIPVCNHDINTNNHTMSFYKRRFMVVPDYVYANCKTCGARIVYIKTDGGYSIAEEDKNES